MKAAVESRVAHAPHHLHPDEGNDHGASEDQGQAWLPSSEDIEKALSAGGVQHARQREAEAEDDTGSERYGGLEGIQDGRPSPLMTEPATTPLVRKVATAAIDRGDRRASPRTPCPLVQPDPSLEPKPTRSPAMMISGQPAVIST